MSWSLSAVGKAVAVAAKLKKDFANIKCSEPEETIKNQACAAIATALAAFPPGQAVSVSAGGSRSVADHKKPEEAVNSLSIKIEPLWGFVE